ncbi:hypothetical protein [Clostridium sp. K25]|uniref:hypothetical protein n=2 Tax=Clostridiaceae TaxID=31979 RepID=UPI00058073D2|nr:hypothetical protein [Clostridium sp. K25]
MTGFNAKMLLCQVNNSCHSSHSITILYDVISRIDYIKLLDDVLSYYVRSKNRQAIHGVTTMYSLSILFLLTI